MEAKEKIKLLEPLIGKTPLYELKFPEFNGNKVFAKAEFLNPTGSHYDRVYLELFKTLLQKNPLPKDLIEVSSGNAGISFAYFCKYLGFKAEIIIPAAVRTNARQIIRRINPEITISLSQGKYLEGAVEYLKNRLTPGVGLTPEFLNHSRRQETLSATEKIALESLEQLNYLGINKIDYFVAACGNGSTIIGPGRVLKKNNEETKIIVFEPQEAPVGYCKKTGEKPTESDHYKHIMYGTGAWGIEFPFIHKDMYGFSNMVEKVVRITKKEFDEALLLRFKVPWDVGYTSLNALYVVQSIINETKCKNCTFLTIFYDTGEKYAQVGD